MLRIVALVIFSNLFLLTYGQKKQTDLSDFFTMSEIEDLNLIADFFQSELCGSMERSKFGNCINSSLFDLADWSQYYLQDNISWRKQKRLYKQISDSTFSKIWSLCKTWRLQEPKYEYETICFSQKQNFSEFLLALGKSNPYLKSYAIRLVNIGDFESGNFLVWDIVRNPKNWDLEDRNVQIALAVHFLTQNDRQKRDKKALRLEKRDLRKMNKNARGINN